MVPRALSNYNIFPWTDTYTCALMASHLWIVMHVAVMYNPQTLLLYFILGAWLTAWLYA